MLRGAGLAPALHIGLRDGCAVIATTTMIDANLSIPWGLVTGPALPVWIDNYSNIASLYSGTGQIKTNADPSRRCSTRPVWPIRQTVCSMARFIGRGLDPSTRQSQLSSE